jgi:hypothetical protein
MLRTDHRTLVIVTLGFFIPSQALAYVVPGTTGMVSQIL